MAMCQHEENRCFSIFREVRQKSCWTIAPGNLITNEGRKGGGFDPLTVGNSAKNLASD